MKDWITYLFILPWHSNKVCQSQLIDKGLQEIRRSQQCIRVCAVCILYKDLHFTQVQRMKTHVPQNLPWYCFQSIYVDTILVEGYRFDPNTTWRTIHFVESVSMLFFLLFFSFLEQISSVLSHDRLGCWGDRRDDSTETLFQSFLFPWNRGMDSFLWHSMIHFLSLLWWKSLTHKVFFLWMIL